MSKPLELTIHPPLKRPRTGAEIMPYQKARRREMNLAESKRLTPAELAAEFWQLAWAVERGAGELEEQEDVMYRFATLPHYDEDQS